MDAHPAEHANVLAPIVIELAVPCPPARAFDYFTRDIARWWPLSSLSVGLEASMTVVFEPHAGGRIVETLRDGSTSVWGTVSQWRPPEQVAFSWHPGRDAATAQWVDVKFAPHPEGTRVTLTHGGWETLGEDASAKRNQYSGGWQMVLGDDYGGYVRAAAPSQLTSRRE